MSEPQQREGAESEPTALLAHTALGPPDATETLILAHGILGSGRNWRSFGQRLVAARRALRVVLVDLRGHGDSHGLSGPATVDACATDLVALGAFLATQPPLTGTAAARADAAVATHTMVLVGHSFGGKVCAAAAALWPTPVRQLWVLDAPLGTRPPQSLHAPQQSEVETLVAALTQIPMPTQQRSDVATALKTRGFSAALCAWMTTNVRREAAGYVWRFDLDVVNELLADYYTADLWPAFSLPRPGARHFLIRGDRSDRWTPADIARLAALERAGRARDIVLENAGHWLHADNPTGLLQLMIHHL